MTSRSKSAPNKSALSKAALRKESALRKTAAQRKSSGGPAAKKAAGKTGKLPEWNLADLYSGIDAPEVARDLQKMDADCVAFETDYKGKLAENTLAMAAESGSPRRSGATRRSTTWPAGSAPMPASFMPATASIPRSRNSMATSPSG
jgi:oligoendopeptidase F